MAIDGDFDFRIREFFELNELSAQHASEQKKQRAGHEVAKRALENESSQKLQEYLSLESVEELRAAVEELHKKAAALELRDLDRKQQEERAALKKSHEEIERKRWDQVVEADIPPDKLQPTAAPRSSVLAKPTAAPLPSSVYSASPGPAVHKQGPLMAPAVSGEMRGYGIPPNPTRHGALPIISHLPSQQGSLGYSTTSRASLDPSTQQRTREASVPGNPVANHGPAAPYPPSVPAQAYQQPMAQLRVDLTQRPNPYASHATSSQMQQPAAQSRRPLPQERNYGGSQDPRASVPPTNWNPAAQAAQQPTHSRITPGYHSGPPSLAVLDTIGSSKERLASQSAPIAPGRDPAPILATPTPTPTPRPIQPDPNGTKRKATNGDDASIGGSAKRPRHDGQAHGMDRSGPTDRTIPFEEVYKDGNPEYRHIIIQFPDGGDFYILRCDEHGVHFGEHPLRGAAKHLASAQHGRMSKEHSKAVETLGCVVAGCTPEKMEMNNKMVLKAFQEGYKPFNANQLSKTARAMKGFPQLDKQGLPIANPILRQPKKVPGMAKAKPGELYVAFNPESQKHFPVLILPWASPDLAAVGIAMTLEEAGLLVKEMRPKCFEYELEGDEAKAVKGWASGYQDGGVNMKQREFPGVYIADEDPQRWMFGWVEAKHLSPFDFDDAKRAELPGFDTARNYYATSVRKFPSWADLKAHQAAAAQQPSFSGSVGPSPSVRTGRQPLPSSRPVKDKDVEMVDVGNHDDSDQESDQGSSGKSTTNSDNDVDMANVDSRRTSVSNRDDSQSTAKLIAAQALSLQTPTPTSTPAPAASVNSAPVPASASAPAPASVADSVPRPGFVAVNSPGFTAVNHRSAASSPAPAARPASVPTERRRVEKIHASSKNPYRVNQGAATPSAPASGTPQLQAPQVSPAAAARKPSPASLQHILHDDTESPKEAPATSSTDSRQLTASPQPLSSIVVRTNVQGVSRSDRAESVPVRQAGPGERELNAQRSTSLTPSTPAFVHNTNVRLQLPSVQPLPSQHQYPTPLPSATESVTGRTPLPALSFSRSNEMSPARSDVATSTVSGINSRSNSPGAVSLAPVKSEAEPEVDMFGLAKVQVEGADVFVSTPQYHQFVLQDDHKSGVLKATEDVPEELRSFTLDPKLIKSATRILGHDNCTVDMVLNDGKTITLVFETAKMDNYRMETGKVQARRFCRRLMAWNKLVECR